MKGFFRVNGSLFVLIIIILVSISLVIGLSVVKAQGDDSERIPALTPEGKINPKLSPRLNQLVLTLNKKGLEEARRFLAEKEMRTREELIETILIIPSDDFLEELSAETIALIESKIIQIGGEPGNHAFNYIQAWIPLSALPEVAEWEEVEFVREPTTLPRKGKQEKKEIDTETRLFTSEGASLIGASGWHNAGFSGQGIKVGVLDLGFEGHQSLLGTELPTAVTTKVFGTQLDFLSTEHGTACAEIIHDIAPGAELFLVNCTNIEVDIPNAVTWLENNGVDVISCSIGIPIPIYTNLLYEALYGNTDIQLILDQFEDYETWKSQWDSVINHTADSGILWSQSAGNCGQKRCSGYLEDTDYDWFLNFAIFDNSNEISFSGISSGEAVYVALLWAKDTGLITNDDYDLYITDENGDIVARSEIYQSVRPVGVEACKFYPISWKRYSVKVINWSAWIHHTTIVLGHDGVESKLEHADAGGTVVLAPPASNINALTVGAVRWNNWGTIERFSCQGPTDDGRIKPDFVAPDGVSTWSYGSNHFFGTSAAAPHLAGAAALVLQANPQYSPQQVKTFLVERSRDLGTAGQDNVYGNGLVNLGTAPQPPQPPSNRFYFPHITSDGTWETEVVVINRSASETVSGELKGYSSAGQEVGSVAVTLAPHGRREIVVGTEFGSAATIRYGVFECGSNEVTGCARLSVEGKWRVALPAVRRINAGAIYIPHIASDETWETEIALVNTTASSASVTVAFDNGTSKTVTLGAKGYWSSSIRELFQGTPQGDIHSAVIESGAGIIGAELFSGGNLLSGVLVTDETASSVYYPHVVMNPGTWITGIVAYNPSAIACTMTVTPYGEDGTMLMPVTETIGGGERYFGTVTGLGLPAETAWVKIESTQPLTGFEAFINNNNGNQLAGYTGVNISGRAGVLPLLETTGWTAATFVNLEASAARVELRAYSDGGVQIAYETVTVGPNEKYSGGIANLFSQSIAGATYIAYDSDKTVVTFQANGSADNMMLDALQGAF